MLRIVRACTVGSCLLILAACRGGGTTPPPVIPIATVGPTTGDPADPSAPLLTLTAAAFGILPTNTDAQNDVGFAALKTKMQSSPTTTWKVFFAPGAYTYTNDRWLWGVRKVIIDAYDCTLQNTSTDAGNFYPFDVGDFFTDVGDVPFPASAAVHVNGYLFNTAAAGAIAITTATHADAGNFTPGMRVLVHGYDQQGSGYPPNMRYFEYKTVLTADAGTGVVTFTDHLAYGYDSRWWDTANYSGTALSFGAPRILSLERANYKRPILIWIKGATFLANPTYPTPAANVLQLSADLLIYEDVSAPAFNTGQTDVQIMRGSKFAAQSTCDKLHNRLVLEDTTLNDGSIALTDCVGVNNLSLIRSKFNGSINQIAPRNLFVDNSDIIPPTGSYTGLSTETNRPLRAVSIANTRVYNTGGGNFQAAFGGKGSPGFSLTVGSVVGTDIRIAFDATGQAVAQQIEYGMTLTNTVTGNTGIITAIYWETGSPGTLRIAGTWSAPTASDVFYYYDVMQVSDGGGNTIIGTQVPFWITSG